MKKHKKLVRDRIPEIIRGNGEVPVVRTLKTGEYKKALLDKLVEESKEAKRAKNKDELVTELADVSEVLEAIMAVHKIECGEVSKVRRKRKKERGSFKKKIFLESTK